MGQSYLKSVLSLSHLIDKADIDMPRGANTMKQDRELQKAVQDDALMKTQYPLVKTENGKEDAPSFDAKQVLDNSAEHNQEAQGQNFLDFLLSIMTFFHTFSGEAYASMKEGNLIFNLKLNDLKFKLYVAQLFFESTGTALKNSYFRELLEHFIALALFKGPELKVYMRLAEHDRNIYVDLCDEEYRVVRITPKGWTIINSTECPVNFIRTPRMMPMATPVKGGSFDALLQAINIKDKSKQILLISWIVGTFNPDGPYPILVIQGEQGSGKSNLSRIVLDTVGPCFPSLCSMPTTERDLILFASKTRVSAFDNISTIKDSISDTICRISTGGGHATKANYTNDQIVVTNVMCPVILNGINEPLTRPDAIDRSVPISTSPIPKDERKTEKELQQEWEVGIPSVIGAICDAVSCALRNRKVKPDNYPRMADHTHWVKAAEPSLPWEPGEFVKVFTESRSIMVDDAIESDLVASEVLRLVKNNGEWSGTPTELLTDLTQSVSENKKRDKTWPKLPNALSRKLRRNATFLREKNIDIQFSKSGVRNITIQTLPGEDVAIPLEAPEDEFTAVPPEVTERLEMLVKANAAHLPSHVRKQAAERQGRQND
jgi:hypothetical protein